MGKEKLGREKSHEGRMHKYIISEDSRETICWRPSEDLCRTHRKYFPLSDRKLEYFSSMSGTSLVEGGPRGITNPSIPYDPAGQLKEPL